jgi:hypothetical protein
MHLTDNRHQTVLGLASEYVSSPVPARMVSELGTSLLQIDRIDQVGSSN